jgi:DNA-binding transcriptional ArsR family regulator
MVEETQEVNGQPQLSSAPQHEPQPAARTFKPAPEMVIDDLETLRVLADPLRLSIVEYLSKPGTVKRVAEKLGKPPTKLYYHFNLLEKHGIITLVDTRIVSGIIEKHYQASAQLYRLRRGLLSPGAAEPGQELDLTLSSMFADTKNDIVQSVRDGVVMLTEDAADHQRLIIGGANLHLTHEQAQQFLQRIYGLIQEFRDQEITQEPQSHPHTTVKARLHKLFFLYYPSSRVLNDDDEPESEPDA